MKSLVSFFNILVVVLMLSGCSSDSSSGAYILNNQNVDSCEVTTEVSAFSAPNRLNISWGVASIDGVNIDSPTALAHDKQRDVIYIAHTGGSVISKLSSDGNASASSSIGSWIIGFNSISAMEVLEDKLYVADSDRVLIFDLLSVPESANNNSNISNAYIDNSVVLNDMALDNAGNIYLSVASENKLYKILSTVSYGNIDLDQDYDVTLYLSNINSLYNADCNIIYGGSGAYLSKLVEGQPAVVLVNHPSNIDPTNLTSIDLYNLNSNGDRTYLVADNESEVKVVYDINKTIRSLQNGSIGANDVGRFVYIRDTSTLVIPRKNSDIVQAYLID